MILSEHDIQLFHEGKHHFIYEKLGCHLAEINDTRGAYFAVWAPNAQSVSVTGSFNHWDGKAHPMRRIAGSGIWELFIPGVKEGDLYKYEIRTPSGKILAKSDPYAFCCEKPPNTASIVYDHGHYPWGDEEWMKKRKRNRKRKQPLNIYEVHAGSWKHEPDPENPSCTVPLSYRKLAETLIPYVKDMGYTHIELLPIMEHPYTGSWGYQITGYYSVTGRYGTPEDFKYFVDTCHKNNIGVILDWVPAHFPKDIHGLARFDGTCLYEYEDRRKGEHLEWGTLVFNYGRSEVRNFLIANALFWFDKYHIDGLRVDAVASMLYLDYSRKPGEWIPNKYGGKEHLEAIEFLKELNAAVHRYFPDAMMIAEESTAWPRITVPVQKGGLGFSHKWNMGWMNDFLKFISLDFTERKHHPDLITFSFMYAFSENFVQVLSHDEVVHGKRSLLGKMPGDCYQKFAGLRCAFGYFLGHPGKKLLFMGGEFGQTTEWNYNEGLSWHLLESPLHEKLRLLVRDLNHLYRNQKALFEKDDSSDGFEWIGYDAGNCILAFARKGEDLHDMLVFVCNFTPRIYESYPVGVPVRGIYREILNTDNEKYGGINVLNKKPLMAKKVPCHDKSWSIAPRIPPLATIILKIDAGKAGAKY